MVKVTKPVTQQQHDFYDHPQPGICLSGTFSSLSWTLSSWNSLYFEMYFPLVSPLPLIYISCGHIMNSSSFQMEEDSQWTTEVLILLLGKTDSPCLADKQER